MSVSCSQSSSGAFAIVVHGHELRRGGAQGGPPFAVSPELYDELLPPAGALPERSLTDTDRVRIGCFYSAN